MNKRIKTFYQLINLIIVIFLLNILGSLNAQTIDDNKLPREKSIKIGTEVDALPYLTGGYYGSIFIGYKNYRIRGIVTKVFPPKFVVPEYFKEYELDVSAILLDRFFGKKKCSLQGFWAGIGIEFWDNHAVNKIDLEYGSFKNIIFTVGGGYVWKFYGNFFLNPWIAGHLIFIGDIEKQIGNRVFKLNRFTPEISIKLGYHF